jgi:hypothetical protein
MAAAAAVPKAGRTGRASMSVVLLIVGILATGAGIVTIGFGIPINEFNLGNTMIVAGTTAVAGGLILIGLAAAVDQLTQIAKALRPRAGARPGLQPQPAEQAFAGATRPGQVQVQVPVPVPGQVKPPMPAPPSGPVFAKPKTEERVGEPAPAQSESQLSLSAIERLRSSLARADRKAGDVANGEDVADSGVPAQAAPAASGPERNTAANAGSNGAAAAGSTGAGEAPKKPPLDFLFRSRPREPQPEAFDAVWPQRGARRPEQPAADPGGSAKPAAPEAPSDRPLRSEMPASSPPDAVRPAAILKSGVVDGMAYTLYADGSIEAQLPQGTVRFGSIAELRSHIENNS